MHAVIKFRNVGDSMYRLQLPISVTSVLELARLTTESYDRRTAAKRRQRTAQPLHLVGLAVSWTFPSTAPLFLSIVR